MRKLCIIITINLILPILLVVIPSLLIRTHLGTSNIVNEHQISLLKGKPITFTFNSDFSNLQSVSLDFKNPNLSNNSQINVGVKGPTNTRSVVFFGSNIGDPSTVPIKFPKFADPPHTQYQVTLTTDNITDGSIYLLANKNNLPVFKTYYQETSFKENLESSFYHQINLFKQRSQIHNFVYLLLLIILECSIIFL